MSEEDVRGGMRDAVADEPPLVLDTDALVATARQQVTRRRALVAVGAATVAVAVAAVAIPLAIGRGTTQVGAQPVPPVPSTSAEPAIDWPPPNVTPRQYSAAELRVRGKEMSAYLRDAVQVVLPNASEVDVGEFGGEATGHFADGQTNVNTAITFTVDGAQYSVMISLWVPGVPEPSPTTLCPADDPCQKLGTHAGGPVLTTSYVHGQKMITTVYHFRETGAIVSVAGYNYNLAADAGQPYPPTPPVTLDQLTRLATDPELGL